MFIYHTEDLRIRRTRKLLMQALIKLTVEKGFAAITVQDIANRAMVNRATFYRHYLDMPELFIACWGGGSGLVVERRSVVSA